MEKKIRLFGCPSCGSEITKIEAIKSRGRCPFCEFGNSKGEVLEILGMVKREDTYLDLAPEMFEYSEAG